MAKKKLQDNTFAKADATRGHEATIVSEGLGAALATPAPVSDTTPEVDYVDFLSSVRKTENDTRKPHEREWNENWSVFNKEYDFSKKEKWQAKQPDPKLNNAIHALTFLIKRAVIQAGTDFFEIEPMDKTAYREAQAPDIKKIIYYNLMKDESGFLNSFVDSLQSSFLTALFIFKMYPTVNEDKRGYTIKVDPVSPYHLWVDSTGRNRYLIHRSKLDLDILRAAGPESGYDMSVIEDIQGTFADATADYREKKQRNETVVSLPAFRAETTIDEFWGDVWNEDGRIVKKNCTFAVANEKFLLRKPIDNPMPDKDFPFVIGAPLRKAFSNYHQPMASNAASFNRSMTDLLNIGVDGNFFKSIPSFEVDVDQIVDPQEVKSGIFPGKAFKRYGNQSTSASPLIRQILMQGSPADTIGLYKLFDSLSDNSMGTTEFVMGGERLGARPTATEVSRKTEQSTSYLMMLAEGLEEQIIGPFLSKYWANLCKYSPDPKSFYNILPEKEAVFVVLNGLEKVYGSRWTFKAKGMSAVLGRTQELMKLKNFFEMLKAFPQVGQRIDIDELLTRVIINFGWSPKDIVLSLKEKEQNNTVPNIAMPGVASQGGGNPMGAALQGAGIPGMGGMQ